MDMAHMAGMNLYFEAAAMILTLVTIGKYMESRSKSHTSDAITKLIGLAPKTGTGLTGWTGSRDSGRAGPGR